jgi:hypothetical protein
MQTHENRVTAGRIPREASWDMDILVPGGRPSRPNETKTSRLAAKEPHGLFLSNPFWRHALNQMIRPVRKLARLDQPGKSLLEVVMLGW